MILYSKTIDFLCGHFFYIRPCSASRDFKVRLLRGVDRQSRMGLFGNCLGARPQRYSPLSLAWTGLGPLANRTVISDMRCCFAS